MKIADQTRCVSEKEMQDTKKALAVNAKSDTWFLEQEMAKEKEKFKKALEKEMWKDYGSRIEAREKALGPNDPEVMKHRQEQEKKLQEQKQLEAARANKNIIRQNFSKQAEHQKQIEQQRMKDQFRNNSAKTR